MSDNKSLATIDSEGKAIMQQALRSSFYPGASDASINMVLTYCQAAGLDPMTKPVHIVPMYDKNAKIMRDVIMPGIGMYRIIADRSGKYAGQDDEEFGPERQNWGMNYPEWCKVTVYKITPVGRVAYSAKVFWLEAYAVQGRDSDAPNAMWRKRPYGQLSKCAESAALRKAFPEIGMQPTAEEMEGRMLEGMAVEPVVLSTTATGASRTDQLKNALRSRMGVATPEIVVDIIETPVPPVSLIPPVPADEPVDAATLQLLMDAVAKAPTKEEAVAICNDAAEMGVTESTLSQMNALAQTRAAELALYAELANTQTAAAVKKLAARIEKGDLPKPVITKLMVEARQRYKTLNAGENQAAPAAPLL